MKNSGDENSIRRGTKVDDVIADGETAVLPRGKFEAKFSHFRLCCEDLARLMEQVQKGIGTLPTAALSGDVLADFDQIAHARQGKFRADPSILPISRAFPVPRARLP